MGSAGARRKSLLCGSAVPLTCQSADSEGIYLQPLICCVSSFSKTRPVWWLADGGVWHVPPARSSGNGLTKAQWSRQEKIERNQGDIWGNCLLCDPRAMKERR